MHKAINLEKTRSVDDYLRSVPESMRAALDKLRNTIKAGNPRSHQQHDSKFQVPRSPLAGFSATKSHFSSQNWARMRAAELKGFNVTGATIHFTPDYPFPVALVKKLVKSRIEENEAISGLTRIYVPGN